MNIKLPERFACLMARRPTLSLLSIFIVDLWVSDPIASFW
jgi:hypothetical protein